MIISARLKGATQKLYLSAAKITLSSISIFCFRVACERSICSPLVRMRASAAAYWYFHSMDNVMNRPRHCKGLFGGMSFTRCPQTVIWLSRGEMTSQLHASRRPPLSHFPVAAPCNMAEISLFCGLRVMPVQSQKASTLRICCCICRGQPVSKRRSSAKASLLAHSWAPPGMQP